MGVHDRAGAIVAFLALALAAVAWVWSPPSWARNDAPGLGQASEQALELQSPGQSLEWRGDGGALAAITPSTAFRDGTGRWCRPYSVAADVAAGSGQYMGCRDDKGQWTLSAVNGGRDTVQVARVDVD